MRDYSEPQASMENFDPSDDDECSCNLLDVAAGKFPSGAVNESRRLEQPIPEVQDDPLELEIRHWQQTRDIARTLGKTGELSALAIPTLRKQVEEQNKVGWATIDARGNKIPISIQYVVDRLNDELRHSKSPLFVTHQPGKQPEFVVATRPG